MYKPQDIYIYIDQILLHFKQTILIIEGDAKISKLVFVEQKKKLNVFR